MLEGELIREYELADGAKARIHDVSRHYFGGYYHVRLQVTADVPLHAAWFENSAEYEAALGRFGKTVRFSRMLEKMAVPQSDLVAVRTALLDAFAANLHGYLSRADFPRRFVLSECAKSRNSAVTGRYGRP